MAVYESAKELGEEDPLVKMAWAKLEEARAKRDQGKAASVRAREAERVAARRKKESEGAQKVAQDLQAKLDDAQKEATKKGKELEEAEEQLKKARAVALEEAGGDPAEEAIKTLLAKVQGDQECEGAIQLFRKKAAAVLPVPDGAPGDGSGRAEQGRAHGQGAPAAHVDGMQVDFDALDERTKQAFIENFGRLGAPGAGEGEELEAGYKKAWASFQSVHAACKRARTHPYSS